MSDSGDDVAASPVRSVYKGTAADVAKAVSPFVDKPCWLKYGEVMGKCRVEPGKLLPHVRLLASLHRLQTNLSFPQGVTAEVMQINFEQSCEQWGTSDWDAAKITDWTMTMAKRIRVMCRHVMQTYLRNPKTSWLKMSFAFLFHLQSQPAEPPTNQVDYFVVFDYEVFKPWRAKVGSKTKETTDSVEIDIDLCKPISASWPEGFQSKIADITSEDWLTKTGTVKTLPCQTSLHPWSAIHSVTKERIHIYAQGPPQPLQHVQGEEAYPPSSSRCQRRPRQDLGDLQGLGRPLRQE
jgi:hypothetical protein